MLSWRVCYCRSVRPQRPAGGGRAGNADTRLFAVSSLPFRCGECDPDMASKLGISESSNDTVGEFVSSSCCEAHSVALKQRADHRTFLSSVAVQGQFPSFLLFTPSPSEPKNQKPSSYSLSAVLRHQRSLRSFLLPKSVASKPPLSQKLKRFLPSDRLLSPPVLPAAPPC